MPTRRAAALALLLPMLAACTGGGDDRGAPPATTRAEAPTTPTTAPATTTTTVAGDGRAGTLAWAGCGGGRECATLAVPLDYGDPEGATIDLALVRVPASDQENRIGSLLVNPGGPGASGLDFVNGGFSFGGDVDERFDVVGWDPRGVGASTHLECGDTVDEFLSIDSEPDDAIEQQELDAAAKRVADECGEKDGALLPHIGTDDTVRDMESIRAALGEDQISYVGFSYGTLLGERFAEAFPTSARAIVLDGVVDPSADLAGFLRGQTIAIERTMADVFDSIGSDAASTYDEVAKAVEREPIGQLGPADLATAAIFVTYDPTAWGVFGRALTDAAGGDGSTLELLAQGYRSFGGFTAYAGVECVDGPHPEGAAAYQSFADELDLISPRFGGAIANELLPCAFWPVPPVGRPADIRAPDAPPILVIGNTGDAATPYEQAVKVADTLQSGHLITYEGQGHTSFGSSDCVDDAVRAYLVDLTLPADGTTCR